jgi:hypothetical protein
MGRVEKNPFVFENAIDLKVDVAESGLEVQDGRAARKVLEDAVRNIPEAALHGMARGGIRSFRIAVVA